MMSRFRTLATRGAAMLALLFLALMSAGALIQPPEVRRANAPDQFDAAAAQARLVRILGDEAPHPVDSAALDGVRERLLAEIAALGLAPEVRDDFLCVPQHDVPLVDCARIRNVVFSVGPQAGPAVLAAAHYDAVPAGPGASDDGIGLAAWLEAARVLAGADLDRRVIFLFSDGEEPALFGAQAFMANDPLAGSVEAIVNLEARGVRGPAMFFETGAPNADSVRAYGEGAARPLANSIMADVYALLPNSTDVTVLRRPNVDIVNIALLEGVERYHTPQDSLANFSARSLQHMGDSALGVARAFAEKPDVGAEETLVFTDIATFGFIAMPAWLAQLGLAFGFAAACAFFWFAGAPRHWLLLAAPLAICLFAGATAWAAGWVLAAVRAEPAYWFAHPEFTRAWCLLLALLGVTLGLALFARSARPYQVQSAGMVWFAAIGLAGSFALPGVSILFLPPVVVFCLAAAIGLKWPPARAIGAIAAAVLALLLWAPPLYLLEAAMGYDLPFAASLVAAVLAITWLGPLAAAQGEASWRPAAIAVSAATIVALAFALLGPAWSVDRPQPLNIVYARDAGAQQARVLAGSARRALPPELAGAGAFERAQIIPGDPQLFWAVAADDDPSIPTPSLSLVGIDETETGRVVRARLQTSGVYRVTLRIPRAARPLSVTVNGAEASFGDVSAAGDFLNLACHGRACDEAEIAVAFAADGEPLDWLVIGQSPGVHPIAAPIVRARPQAATPIQFGDSIMVLSGFSPRPAAP